MYRDNEREIDARVWRDRKREKAQERTEEREREREREREGGERF